MKNSQDKQRALSGVLTMMVTLPIWFYLLYEILVSVGASDLMWFLYWVYVPVTLLASYICRWYIGD